ncbi:Gldg family protein [uncultured Salegentibacter sp.]|uniref:Gldg family protein n=1 Tax=uncultured Salegentibacter sp. TaxID=259320 RepID=UPI00259A03BC|nr:Gldg family protein [uncultured Salegentibacter sp.]
MKKIFNIARLELSILFYSPIAWIILIIFTIQSGITFVDLLEAREASQQLGSELKGLTMDIFGGGKGFFAAVQNKLYLYIPLLTMGLMSREISSGSIKLLLSSPVTNRQIILGKFLSMLLYGLLLIAVLLIIIIIAGFSIEALDIKFLFGGLLGLYFLICAYAAIGLFMSSLTSYQVVAAVSTLAVLAALNFIGTIGQSIDFVRDITYWISIEGRADNFLNGLISSKDVLYFFLVIVLFLTLTIMRLNSGREVRSSVNKVSRYALLIFAVLAIGYLSSLPALNAYYDTTRFKDKTLTDNSIELLENLEEPITITNYVNVINSFAHLGSPKWRIFDLKQFDQYTRYLPDLEMKYVTYYDSTLNSRDNISMTLEERGQRSATAYGFEFEKALKPEEIRKEIDLRPEENLFVRTVEHKGKTSNLRMFYDMFTYPHEAEISAAIKRLLQEPPVIGVITNNDTRRIDLTGDKHYKDVLKTNTSRYSLINQGFDINEINLDESENIPSDLTALILADPMEEFSESKLEKINNYLEEGGNLLIAGEPGKQHLLNPILEKFGLEFNQGSLLQESEKYELDLIQATLAEEADFIQLDFSDKDVISLPGAIAINKIGDNDSFEVTPLLYTNPKKVWNKETPFNLETDSINFNPASESRNDKPVAVALEKKVGEKDQKIVVIGDADFMSNGELGRFNIRTKNSEFVTKLFNWFSDYEFPIDATRPEPIDNKILVNQEEISWIEKFLLGFMPLSLAFAGGFLLISRKRN